MSGFNKKDFEEEFQSCSKLYPGFNEIRGIIKAAYEAGSDFFNEHVENAKTAELFLSEEEIQQKFRLGEPLHPQVQVSKEMMEIFIGSLEEEIIREDNYLKDALEEFKKEFISQAFPASKKSFDFTSQNVSRLLELAPDSSLGSDLSTFMSTFILSSLYQFYLGAFPQKIDTTLWEEGYCPVCGSSPHFGVLKEEGARYLECWLCSTRWWFSRLQCPFCSNSNHETLGYFTLKADEQENKVQRLTAGICHVHFCMACNSYFKVFDARACENEDMLLSIHNLATLSHDVLARKEGFLPGSHLQWIGKNELHHLVN